MTGVFSKCCKISHIVRLRQMLRRWRARAAASSAALSPAPARVPRDVPAGHVAVRVGSSSTRFVVRAAHLNHPAFRRLLAQAEEEYGFAHPGPLAIPCDEDLFEEVLRHLNRSSSRCHADARDGGWHESALPLLHALAEGSAAW